MSNKAKKYDLEIPEENLKSLARTLLPIFTEYLMSEQGKKDWEEWQKNKQINIKN